jgi:hypothetical protein
VSDSTETPTTTETPKTEAAPPRAAAEPKGEDGLAAALKSLAAERDQALAEVKARDKKIAELSGERDAFKGQVEQFGRQQREGALIERLQRELPGADKMALRGVVAVLGESNKIDRHPPAEQLEEVAKKALELIKTEAPGLTRSTTSVGGNNGVPSRPQNAPRFKGPFDLQRNQ